MAVGGAMDLSSSPLSSSLFTSLLLALWFQDVMYVTLQ